MAINTKRDDLFNAVDETGGVSMREKREKAARALHRTASHATCRLPACSGSVAIT